MFKKNDLKEVVLIDFGISNFYEVNKAVKILGFTTYYCPPEIE